MTHRVQITLVSDEFALSRAHDGDAGLDLRANITEPVVISPGERAMIPIGVSMAMSAGVMFSVRPRSGLAAKHGVTVLNSPGTVDSGYRDEIKVVLVNHGAEDFTVSRGERIAQGVFEEYLVPEVEVVRALSDSERGTGGFGSSGRS